MTTDEDRAALDAVVRSAIAGAVTEAIGGAEARLLEAIGASEARMNERLGWSEARLSERLDAIGTELRELNAHVSSLDTRLGHLEDLVFALNETTADLGGQVAAMKLELRTYRLRLDREERTGAALRGPERTRLDDLDRRVRALETGGAILEPPPRR